MQKVGQTQSPIAYKLATKCINPYYTLETEFAKFNTSHYYRQVFVALIVTLQILTIKHFTKLNLCGGTTTKINIFKFYPFPLVHLLYSCENAENNG